MATSNLPLEVRAGQPQDIPDIVACHQSVFPHQPQTAMGPRWLADLYEQYVNRRDGIALVAHDPAGNLLGFVVGGPPEISASFRRTAKRRFWYMIAWRLLTSRTVRETAWTIFRQSLKRPRHGGAATGLTTGAVERRGRRGVLVCIAVSTAARGQGVADALLSAFVDEARAHGFDYLTLGVYTDNARAIRFYEKHGWHREQSDNQRLASFTVRLGTT